MSTQPLTQFDFLLNAFEQASQADEPAKHGYKMKAQALREHVRDLERRASAPPAQGEPVAQIVCEYPNYRVKWLKHPKGMDGALLYAPPTAQAAPDAWECRLLDSDGKEMHSELVRAKYGPHKGNHGIKGCQWVCRPLGYLDGATVQPAQPEAPTGDQLRQIAASARTSPSDSPSPSEYVLAGWRAALAGQPAAQQGSTDTGSTK